MTEIADLALVHEVAQRSERLVDVGLPVRTVKLAKVDPVGPEPLQRALDLRNDPATRVAALVRVIAHRLMNLAGQHHVLALTARHRLADDHLRFAAGVHVYGIDEVDPRVQGRRQGQEARGEPSRASLGPTTA